MLMIQTNFLSIKKPTSQLCFLYPWLAVARAARWWPRHFSRVTWPNSGQAGLGGGVSWKAVDLGAKCKDRLCWRKRKGVLLCASVF